VSLHPDLGEEKGEGREGLGGKEAQDVLRS
jgi:hypothetical protein